MTGSLLNVFADDAVVVFLAPISAAVELDIDLDGAVSLTTTEDSPVTLESLVASHCATLLVVASGVTQAFVATVFARLA